MAENMTVSQRAMEELRAMVIVRDRGKDTHAWISEAKETVENTHTRDTKQPRSVALLSSVFFLGGGVCLLCLGKKQKHWIRMI